MVAEETGMAFLSVSAAEIVTKWQGESGKNAKAMFEVSKKICIYSLNAFKLHKINIKNLLMKSSEIVFSLPALYLLFIWLMT